MSTGSMGRALFAAVLGLGVWAGLIRAESPIPMSAGPGLAATVAPVDPALGMSPLPSGVVPPPIPEKPVRSHPICDAIHRRIVNHPFYCWSTHNSLGCSTLKAECTFIFGSCWAFYGEPCFKGPPPPPNYAYYGVVPPPLPGWPLDRERGSCRNAEPSCACP